MATGNLSQIQFHWYLSCQQRFLCCMAFSIHENVHVACLWPSWFVYTLFRIGCKQFNYTTDKPCERITRICTAIYWKLNKMVKMYKANLKKEIPCHFLIVSCLIKADDTFRDFNYSKCHITKSNNWFYCFENHNGKHTVTWIALTLLMHCMCNSEISHYKLPACR